MFLVIYSSVLLVGMAVFVKVQQNNIVNMLTYGWENGESSPSQSNRDLFHPFSVPEPAAAEEMEQEEGADQSQMSQMSEMADSDVE